MARYRLARSDAPCRPMPEGAKVVGGDDTHVDFEIPAGVEVPDVFVPLTGKAKKGKKEPGPEDT